MTKVNLCLIPDTSFTFPSRKEKSNENAAMRILFSIFLISLHEDTDFLKFKISQLCWLRVFKTTQWYLNWFLFEVMDKTSIKSERSWVR